MNSGKSIKLETNNICEGKHRIKRRKKKEKKKKNLEWIKNWPKIYVKDLKIPKIFLNKK